MNLRPEVLASVGLLLLSLAQLSGQNLTGLTIPEQSKRWTVTADLGMFYDDNNVSSPTDPQGSFGIEFVPHVALNLPLARTVLKASYDLRLNYYEARTTDNTDKDHQFSGEVNHRFSERSSVDISETFIQSSQPEVGGEAQTTFLRGDLAHWRNYFRFDYTMRLAPNYGTAFGFRNDYFDYEQTAEETEGGQASLSALLDRSETRAHLEGHYFAGENTRYFGGYQVGFLEYTSSDPLGFDPSPVPPFGTVLLPSYRNTRSQYLYVGGDRQFSQQLKASTSVGGTYTDFYNQDFTDVSPYFQLRANYNYLPGSALVLGAQVGRTATDSGVGTNGVTRDQVSTTFEVLIRHRLAPRLHGTVAFFWQHSVYNGGDNDGEADDSYEVAPGLDYKIVENVFARLEYRRQELFSSRPASSYTRNRVYIGMRVAF